jgi:2,3-bisphosphoglycerate-independent phosphoglycerate mutase
MDKMASAGKIGITRTVPDGMAPGSDVANLSILGYSPAGIYTGRAPFEAAAMGVHLAPEDLAFRLNLVTLQKNYTVMANHSADHITSEEAGQIIESLRPTVESLDLAIYQGISYRHLLVWKDGPEHCITQPPHDFVGEPVALRLPSGERADLLLQVIVRSWKILERHPVNEARRRKDLAPANSVWPWGQGRPPRIKTLTERFGITGSVIAGVDLMKGIGKYAGLDITNVPGATGYVDTNYEGKVQAALRALTDKDFVFLHVEAPDEASHSGLLDLKKRTIEDFDKRVVGPILNGLKAFSRWRILLMPDHHTPVTTRTHSTDPVPFVLLDSRQWEGFSQEIILPFSEETARASGNVVDEGAGMIELLIDRDGK